MSEKNYHVVFRADENKWAVVGENYKRADSKFNTQKEAIDRANDLVRTSGGKVKIHRKSDNTFRT